MASKSQLTKIDMLSKVLKLKKKLDDNVIGSDWSKGQKNSAHYIINQVLDVIAEYRY